MVNNRKIFCFGELLLRMSPVLGGEWLRQASIPLYLGGAELNVATALACWNMPVAYCTVLPSNYLSTEICEALRQKNIEISAIHFSGKRIGVYFLPQGADLKNTEVLYDRANSSFSELRPGMINWGKVLDGFSWFHFSAITPALNENLAAVCEEALAAAAKKKMTISVDLNYRPKLWQYGKLPVEIMPPLVDYCDVIMGNIWSAGSLLGIPVDSEIHQKGEKKDYLKQARETALSIQLAYPNCKAVANTFRFDDPGEGISYYSSFFRGKDEYHSREYESSTVVDKVGAGDCFMAGLIYGLSRDQASAEIINFATAAAFGKFQEKGDATRQDLEAIRARLEDR
jgi:2-dehydro-3-deoxygluconokinase